MTLEPQDDIPRFSWDTREMPESRSDVEAIRKALPFYYSTDAPSTTRSALAALARLSERVEQLTRNQRDLSTEGAMEAELASAQARVEQLERERDEFKDALDGMARSPYGEFGKWADRAHAAEAEQERLREALEYANEHGNTKETWRRIERALAPPDAAKERP